MQRLTLRNKKYENLTGLKNVREKSCWSRVKQLTKYVMSVPYKRFDELELHESQEVQVRVFDNTIETFRVNQKETPPNICWSLVGEKYGQTLNWIIVEVWRNEGIERPLENHESLFKIQRERIMGHEENRYLTFRSKHEMFTMFKEPEEYHELYKTYDVPMIEKIRLAQLAMDGEISPLFYNQVWIYDSNKTNPSWEQKVLLVMDKKLYFSTCYEPIAALVVEFEKIRMLNSKIH